MMRFKLASLWLLVGFWVSGAVLLAQRAAERPKPAQGVEAKLYIVTPSQIKWTDSPAGVARGTPSLAPGSPLRYAPIQGDPLKPGVPFAIRLRCSDGYKAAPHWHPADENIVVLEGTFSLGTGDRFDTGRMQDIPTGGYGLVPGQMNHFALCEGETDILVYGSEPRLNNWINASSASTLGAGAKPVGR
jgi:ChrR-like protein with cupin domain